MLCATFSCFYNHRTVEWYLDRFDLHIVWMKFIPFRTYAKSILYIYFQYVNRKHRHHIQMTYFQMIRFVSLHSFSNQTAPISTFVAERNQTIETHHTHTRNNYQSITIDSIDSVCSWTSFICFWHLNGSMIDIEYALRHFGIQPFCSFGATKRKTTSI